MKLKKQFFVTDLDGTLFQNNAKISTFSVNTIQRILASGVSFTFATARSLTTVKKVLGAIPFKLPVICFNGGYIYDYATGKPLFIQSFKESLKEDLLNVIQESAYSPFLSTYDGVGEKLYYQGLANDGILSYYQDLLDYKDERMSQISDFREKLEEDWLCLLFIDKKEVLLPLQSLILKEYSEFFELNFYENQNSPGWWWLTLHDRESTKDQAIQKVVTHYGLGDHELIVFGDQMNDYGMFKMADRAVAVDNAVPELKAIAAEIIGSNEEESVIRYIVEELGW